MRITVHNLHDDTQKVFEGDPVSIVTQLVAAHPWLHSPDPADQDLNDVLEHLESSSGYAVAQPSDVDCAAVLVTDGQGRYLFGKRNDNGKWTMPAGHLNPGEDPKEGALRELWEETNLRPQDITFLTSHPLPGGNFLHTFSCLGSGNIHGKNDPDQECDKWEWVDCREGVPANVWDKLHGPDGDDNLIRQVFDLKKSEKIWLEAGFSDLRKKDVEGHDSHNLLGHHDPRERALAIKLDTVSQHDLATALLDPDFHVWQAAFNHPDAPLEVLAMHTRDAAGEPIWPRHDLLLIDPRCKPQHLAMMHRAMQHDAYLPVSQQADRINAMSKVPQAIWLRKSAEAHQELASTSLPASDHKFDHAKEQTQPMSTHLANAYKTHVAGGSEQGSLPTTGSDLDLGGSESKAIYTIPHDQGTTRVMVKPYHDRIAPQAGWAEGTSQHLYRAADLGHLHQESFVGTHGEGKYKVPATVIKLEEAKPISRVGKAEMSPKTGEDARKIAIMDYVTGNADRHNHNLMMRPSGQLLAIDHGSAFDLNPVGDSEMGYNDDQAAYFDHVGKGVDHAGAGTLDQHLQTIKEWWPQVSDKIKAAFEERLPAVKDAHHLAYLREGFARRTHFLDSLTKTNQNRYWAEQPLPK